MPENRRFTKRTASIAAVIYCIVSLTGCAGSRILEEPVPLRLEKALATRSDGLVSVSLDWVIARDWPGTWAKNADWDEYLISVANDSEGEVAIVDTVVVDSMGTEHHPDSNRSQLVKSSRKCLERYKDTGLKVKAGWRGTELIVTGVAAGVLSPAAGFGAAAAAAASGSVALTLAAGGAVVLAGPVIATTGIVRAIRNNKVAKVIEARQTPLPHTVPAGGRSRLDLFFPLAPSPSQIRVSYERGGEQKTLVLDTSEVLSGLHIVKESD